jgi:transketolase
MNIDTEKFALKIRKKVLHMVHNANASHVGSCFSIIDILCVLYGSVIKFDPIKPKLITRDRFILSKGHAAAAVYAILAELNFINQSDLDHYGEDGSLLMTHVNHKIPGVELSTGSLGHGLPFGVGKALVAKRLNQDWRTYVLMSDGEMDAGSNWEALMFSAHHKLDNLIAIIDYNKLQSLTSIENTLGLEPLVDKLIAFGWSVKEVNGHNHEELTRSIESAPWVKGKPSILIAHTTKGKGVSFMENKVEWHYTSPNLEQLSIALKELGED